MPEDMHMSEMEIITDGGRRRRWTSAEKLRIVDETPDERASISVVARRDGVAPYLLYRWRRLRLEAVEHSFGGHRAPLVIELLSDNGSPCIAKDTQIFVRQLGLKPCFTPVKSPQGNASGRPS